MHFDRDEILSRIDLEELADTLLGGRHPRTRSWRCPNPSHKQTGKTPPVTVFPGYRGMRWHCHGCGEGGTAIDLAISAGPASDFREAVEWLADYANVTPDHGPGMRPPSTQRPADGRGSADVPISSIRSMTAYVSSCSAWLLRPEATPVRRWLTDERAIPAEVLLPEKVGADLGPVRLPRPDGLPRAFPAAVFPARVDGELVYVQSRLVQPGDRRWLNPRSTFAPNPRVAELGAAVTERGPVVVTEGVIDGLSAVAGRLRAIALLGAANAGRETVARVAGSRNGSLVLLATDNDDAGRRAREKLRTGLVALGVPVSDLNIPERFKDLNDWHREARLEWDRTLGSAVSLATLGHSTPSTGVELGRC